MAENNVSDLFKGATKGFCSMVLNQVQDGITCLSNSRKVLFWNKAAEQMTGFESSEILDKPCFEDLSLFVDREGVNICRDKCPVELTLKDGTIRSLDVYLRHKDGFRVPATLRIIPVFKEDGAIIGAVETFADTAPKVRVPLAVAELEKMGLLDTETGISNKQFLDMTLKTRLEEFQKYGLPFALIYVDIDNFNKTLEKYGRFNASKILRTVARTLLKNVRYFDIVGRWNNEEFFVVLLNIDESRLDIVANKLRLLVAESYITTETGMLNATVSLGASIVQRYDSVEALVKRTEQLMLHSKWLGKNRISLSFTQKDVG
ncbi:MAG: sensor domain-containing diguanylate cyclase [Candidatus Aminicenantales bacterium]|jgi:diguanylate cyclase (GGDEF)-like protein/PAS domain S-box-containing protein